MMYQSHEMEEAALLQVAAQMCGAARTAPKATGRDYIVTLVLTGEEKEALAEKMREIGRREFGEKAAGWYGRDADNVSAAGALVLIGIRRSYRGIKACSFCGFENCSACQTAGGTCAFMGIDLGIALSSAAMVAARAGVDNRILFSAGKAAMEMGYFQEEILWQGIPIHIAGKNIFFDRKPAEKKTT